MSDIQTDTFEEVHRLVRLAIDEAGTEYHASRLAVEIRERIRLEYPGLFEDWTATLAVDQLKLAIGRLRGMARRPTSALRRAGYDITEEVDGSHTQRKIGDMTRTDLDYVARQYGKRAKAANLRAQRFRALRDRLPDDVTLVRDVIPETDIEAAYNPQ